MSKQKLPPKPKEYSVSQEEYAEYLFVIQNLKTFEETCAFWEQRRVQVENRVKVRLNLTDEKYIVNFSRFFSTQKVTVTEKPGVKVISQPGKTE